MRHFDNSNFGLILVCLALLLTSCSEDATNIELTPTSTFPLTTDSRWAYAGIIYDVPFNDSSLAETTQVGIRRHIIGEDSLGQTADLVVCDDTVVTAGPAAGQIDTSIHRQWLKLEDSKLKLYAYDEFGIGDTAEPALYSFPHNLLDFPLSGGKTWTVYTNIVTQQNKTVVGVDYIELPFGWQYCDVVKGITHGDVPEDTIWVSYEWFTDDGLMHLEYDLGTREIRDEFGTVLDTVRTYETWELTEMDIQP
jgi:hypothetical protein